MVFNEYEKTGSVNPAQILNHFIEGEEQYREVAALFHASLSESLNNEEQRRALSGDRQKDKETQSGGKGKNSRYQRVAGNHQAAVSAGCPEYHT